MAKHRKQPSRLSKCLIVLDITVIIGGVAMLVYLFLVPSLASKVSNMSASTPSEAQPTTESIRQSTSEEANESTTESTVEKSNHSAAEDRYLTSNQTTVTDEGEDLDQVLQDSGFIGSALIVKAGQIILHKGYGYANKEKDVRNQPDTLFNIGSIQKGMTGVLVMRAAAAGQLALSDTLAKYYPDIPNADNITLQQMLQMASGLKLTENPSDLSTETDVLTWDVAHTAMDQSQGVFHYSPINYNLLAGILTKVTGQSYASLFSDYFIQQQGFSQTQLFTTYLQEKLPTANYKTEGEADPYAQENTLSYATLASEIGTGNVYMSVGDLYHYFDCLLHEKLLNKEQLTQLWTPVSGSTYAAGFYDKGNYIRAHGGKGGFESYGLFSKDNQSSVILLSNRGRKSDAQLMDTLYHMVTGVETAF
ncbi:hypothetical protein A5886_000507 [Enterococcus sp. 8G7_MSG3316]|uniref:Beta-lactamase-related domain-containing protein n=1 Tax=Candidatus Enterococcus testudinis TaxID=1834191 RepID=A0A242A318_9ENTE|nr:serine hydrolase domain-containing protein [Enterococcus sp. 8G7_MSG3316]OTN75437.1 hypothetical protein A5886_000507 [Enterococcus sp. 8G7_MSG3316]